MNNKIWMAVGAICLLGMGVFGGSLINRKTAVETINEAEVTGIPTDVPTQVMVEKGTISGYLMYPSESIPSQVGICAVNMADPKMINCVPQVKDKKYTTGVGYEMDLSPGSYYVYAYLKDAKAFYTEFVVCGLKAECKSHTKIPVVVTAGSYQDQILPNDWYEEVPVTTVTATVKPTNTQAPTATPTTKPMTTLVKINPDVIKLIPSNTPTPVKIVVPSIKIVVPQW